MISYNIKFNKNAKLRKNCDREEKAGLTGLVEFLKTSNVDKKNRECVERLRSQLELACG